MTARRTQIPSYRLHKARGTAVVTLEGRNYYLGTYGSPESQARYNRLISDYLRGELGMPGPDEEPSLIGRLCNEFLTWAVMEYRSPDGEVSASVGNPRLALRGLVELFTDIPASEFGPSLLVAYRGQLVSSGCAPHENSYHIAFAQQPLNSRLLPHRRSGRQARAHRCPGACGRSYGKVFVRSTEASSGDEARDVGSPRCSH